jgi:hypothetical protein
MRSVKALCYIYLLRLTVSSYCCMWELRGVRCAVLRLHYSGSLRSCHVYSVMRTHNPIKAHVVLILLYCHIYIIMRTHKPIKAHVVLILLYMW